MDLDKYIGGNIQVQLPCGHNLTVRKHETELETYSITKRDAMLCLLCLESYTFIQFQRHFSKVILFSFSKLTIFSSYFFIHATHI